METAPEIETTGEETSENSEVSSPNEPDYEFTSQEEADAALDAALLNETSAPLDSEEFNKRVEKLMEMMEADPKVRDRLIAETYVNFASAEMGIRGMFEMFQQQGLSGMMKGAFRRGGRD